MKLYFASNKYLTVGAFREVYGAGNNYLEFSVQTPVSYNALIQLLTNEANLTKITCTNDKNEVLNQWTDVYKSLVYLVRSSEGDIIVALSSRENDTEPYFLAQF